MPWMTIIDAAKALGWHHSTIRNRIRSGALTSRKRIGSGVKGIYQYEVLVDDDTRRKPKPVVAEAPPTGPSLKIWREALGLSQRQLAAVAGIARGTVDAIESGRRQPYLTTIRLKESLAAVEKGAGGGPLPRTNPPAPWPKTSDRTVIVSTCPVRIRRYPRSKR